MHTLSSLFIIIPQHYAKVALGLGEKELEQSRQQLASTYTDVEWQTFATYALAVYRHKAATLSGNPTEEQFLTELENCRRFHTLT